MRRASASLLTGIAFLWPQNGHAHCVLADKLLIDFAAKSQRERRAAIDSALGIMKTIFKLKQLMPQAITATATCHRHCHKTVSMKITSLLLLSFSASAALLGQPLLKAVWHFKSWRTRQGQNCSFLLPLLPLPCFPALGANCAQQALVSVVCT